MTHDLKCWPEYFVAVKIGDKTFEVRKHDRDFQPGDILRLRCYDPEAAAYVREERPLRRRVTYVLPGGSFGVEYGYCVMGIKEIR